jgi:H+/Cl- antiporter ClcA
VLFGLSLFAIYGYVSGGRPAFQEVLPTALETAVALPLTVAVALGGGAAGRAFARLVHRLQGHEV